MRGTEKHLVATASLLCVVMLPPLARSLVQSPMIAECCVCCSECCKMSVNVRLTLHIAHVRPTLPMAIPMAIPMALAHSALWCLTCDSMGNNTEVLQQQGIQLMSAVYTCHAQASWGVTAFAHKASSQSVKRCRTFLVPLPQWRHQHASLESCIKLDTDNDASNMC